MKDNYESVTEKCFQPSHGPNGCEPLPDQTYQAGSGFVRQKPVNIPTQAQVSVSIHGQFSGKGELSFNVPHYFYDYSSKIK